MSTIPQEIAAMPKPPALPFQKWHKWFGLELVQVSPAEKLISGLCSAVAIFVLMGFSYWALPAAGAAAVVASMAASIVLLFAVPHGQLSQPWPVIMGHVTGALIGVACARFISDTFFAITCAMGLTIFAMLQLKCVHPPGGATAFTAVAGGASIHQLGFHFVLFPVLTNAVVLVVLAVVLNSSFRWRRYPAILNKPARLPTPGAAATTSPSKDEILAALRTIDSFVDITEQDVVRLVEILCDRRGPRAQ